MITNYYGKSYTWVFDKKTRNLTYTRYGYVGIATACDETVNANILDEIDIVRGLFNKVLKSTERLNNDEKQEIKKQFEQQFNCRVLRVNSDGTIDIRVENIVFRGVFISDLYVPESSVLKEYTVCFNYISSLEEKYNV